MEVEEIHEDELERLVAALRRGDEEAGSAEEYRDWKRQARETIWLVAVSDGDDVGAAIGVGGWHEPEGRRSRRARRRPGVSRARCRIRASCGRRLVGEGARLRRAARVGQGDRHRERRLGAAPRVRRGRAALQARSRSRPRSSHHASLRPTGSSSRPGPTAPRRCPACTPLPARRIPTSRRARTR